MSPNRRIFLNIIATYGRSLYALLVALCCRRLIINVRNSIYGVVINECEQCEGENFA